MTWKTIPKLVGTVSKYGFQKRVTTTCLHETFQPPVLCVAEVLLFAEELHYQRSHHDKVLLYTVSFADNDCVATHA